LIDDSGYEEMLVELQGERLAAKARDRIKTDEEVRVCVCVCVCCG
jgi:membrane-bound ClpP family serine protease